MVRYIWFALLILQAGVDGKSSAKILVASYDVVDSFHSHFVETLAVYLSKYYNVTFLVSNPSAIHNQQLRESTSVSLVQKGSDFISHSTKTKMEVKNGKNSPLEVIRQIAEQTEQATRTLFANSRLLQQIESENYDLMIYNSMDYDYVN